MLRMAIVIQKTLTIAVGMLRPRIQMVENIVQEVVGRPGCHAASIDAECGSRRMAWPPWLSSISQARTEGVTG